MGYKSRVSEHGYSEPKFRGSSIPDTRESTGKSKKEWKKFAKDNPKQDHGRLKNRVIKSNGEIMETTQSRIFAPKMYGKAYGEPRHQEVMTQKEYNYQQFQG